MTTIKVSKSGAKVVVSKEYAKGSGKCAVNLRKGSALEDFFIKLFSLQNAAGDVGPFLAVLVDFNLKVPVVKLQIKRFGVGSGCVGQRWIVQSKTGDLSREIFEMAFKEIVIPWFSAVRYETNLEEQPGVLIVDGERESVDALFIMSVFKAFMDAVIMVLKTGASCSAIPRPNDRVSPIDRVTSVVW